MQKATYFRSSLSLSGACASRAYKERLGVMQKLNLNETFESPAQCIMTSSSLKTQFMKRL